MRGNAQKLALVLTASLCLHPAGVEAVNTDDSRAALEISQAALGNELPPLQLTDASGQSVELGDLRGKPLVLSLVYTSCHHVCPVITRNLKKAVDIGREALGADAFLVATVGFDWQEDTPDRMRMFAAANGVRDPGWYFLSGSEDSIVTLSKRLGFQFARSSKGFDHLSQTTIVDRDGRVYRQVYGVALEAPALVEPLKSLVFDTPSEAGAIEHWVDTFRLFCTVFDPRLGRYRFDYSILMTAITGVLCLGAVGAFIVREWRRPR